MLYLNAAMMGVFVRAMKAEGHVHAHLLSVAANVLTTVRAAPFQIAAYSLAGDLAGGLWPDAHRPLS